MKVTTKSLFRLLYGCLFLSITAGFFVHLNLRPEVHFFWERLPVFSAIYGFIGCIVIILGSKAIGHFWLQKKEDYYEKHEKVRGKN
jgi:uncharacterized membrane protein